MAFFEFFSKIFVGNSRTGAEIFDKLVPEPEPHKKRPAPQQGVIFKVFAGS
jgi:hypothetical protein